MLEQITSIKEDTLEAIAGIGDLKALDDIRVGALGKKGAITGFMKQLGGLDPDERREVGQELNRIKDAVQAAIDTRKSELEWAALNERLVAENVRLTQENERLNEESQRLHRMVTITAQLEPEPE